MALLLQNAESPIAVTVSGMTTCVSVPLYSTRTFLLMTKSFCFLDFFLEVRLADASAASASDSEDSVASSDSESSSDSEEDSEMVSVCSLELAVESDLLSSSLFNSHAVMLAANRSAAAAASHFFPVFMLFLLFCNFYDTGNEKEMSIFCADVDMQRTYFSVAVCRALASISLIRFSWLTRVAPGS